MVMISLVNRSTWNHPFAKALVVLLFLGLLAGWILWPRGLPPPQEKDRTIHPAGYSIIVPPEFEAILGVGAGDNVTKDQIQIRPIKPRMWEPGMRIARLRQAPLADVLKRGGYKDSTFLGEPALESDGPLKHYWVHSIIFQRNGEWFQIDLSLPDFFKYSTSSWRPYVESFRYPDSNWTKPATRPTTTSTTFHL